MAYPAAYFEISRNIPVPKFLIDIFKNGQQESSGRVTEEIVGGANIPAIPLISSRLLLSQVPGGNGVPIFRISHGIHEIEPSAIPESSILQGYYMIIFLSNSLYLFDLFFCYSNCISDTRLDYVFDMFEFLCKFIRCNLMYIL